MIVATTSLVWTDNFSSHCRVRDPAAKRCPCSSHTDGGTPGTSSLRRRRGPSSRFRHLFSVGQNENCGKPPTNFPPKVSKFALPIIGNWSLVRATMALNSVDICFEGYAFIDFLERPSLIFHIPLKPGPALKKKILA